MYIYIYIVTVNMYIYIYIYRNKVNQSIYIYICFFSVPKAGNSSGGMIQGYYLRYDSEV